MDPDYEVYSVLQISLVRGSSRSFRSLSTHFVVFIYGERDLSSLPCLGSVQISLKIEEFECRVGGVADVIS